MTPVALLVRLPVIASVPTALAPPGRIVPLLVRMLAPPPTLTVPAPPMIPVAALVKPPDRVKVVPLARLSVPDWVKVSDCSVSDPAPRFRLPALVNAETSSSDALELVLVKLPLLMKVVPVTLLRQATGQALAVVPE